MQENLEEFLTPITPTKHRPAHPQQYLDDQSSLDSPSKGQARNRLGSLLGQIRTGDSGRVHHPRAEETFEDEIGGDKRGPGRPKKMRREKRVVFELRGKPFGLRDSGHPEAIYALCRKWMYGKDDELVGADDEADEPEFDIPRFKSLSSYGHPPGFNGHSRNPRVALAAPRSAVDGSTPAEGADGSGQNWRQTSWRLSDTVGRT